MIIVQLFFDSGLVTILLHRAACPSTSCSIIFFSIKAQGSGNVKIEFTDWSVPSNADGSCRVMFVSIVDAATADVLTSDTQKKGVSFCGNNPGTFISAGSEIELIIHSDSNPSGAIDLRMFQARVSSTSEAPTPVNVGKSYSQGAIDRRFGAPKPRLPAPGLPQPRVPQLPQQAYPAYPSMQQPVAPAGGMRPRPFQQRAPIGVPPAMGNIPPPPGVVPYERPVYEPAFTRAPDLPGTGLNPMGAQRPNPRRVNPLSGIIPKNHAKKPGATREDKNGRVNTKLISKMQQLRRDGQLTNYINSMKETPSGPGVLAPGALPPVPPQQPPMMNGPGGAVYTPNGQVRQNPILLKHLGNPEVTPSPPPTPPTQPAEDNENMNVSRKTYYVFPSVYFCNN